MKNKLTLLFAATMSVGLPLLAKAQYEPERGRGGSGLANTPIAEIISTVLLWLLMIFTYVAVIGFIVSGIIYITAGGSNRMEEAKQWMIYSIIGVAVGLSGYIILAFITSTLEGSVQF